MAAGIRSHFGERSQTLNCKVRDGETLKVPYLAVVGAREAEAGTVAGRIRGVEGRKQDVMAQHEFVNTLLDQIRTRARLP